MDVDVLLPTKVLDKVVPVLDALLEGDKQVGSQRWGQPVAQLQLTFLWH